MPEWLRDVLTLGALALGTPGIILALLNRKQANRRLVVEEGGLTVDQFNAALPAYKDLLDRSEKAAEEAEKAATAAKEDAEMVVGEFRDFAQEVLGQYRALRDLLRRILLRTQTTMTPDELEELEMTKPRPLPKVSMRTVRKK